MPACPLAGERVGGVSILMKGIVIDFKKRIRI
jgi:hypothetical protein